MPQSREHSEHTGKLCRRSITLHQSPLFVTIAHRRDAVLCRYDGRQRHVLLLERSISEFLQQEVEASVQHFAHHGRGVGRVYEVRSLIQEAAERWGDDVKVFALGGCGDSGFGQDYGFVRAWGEEIWKPDTGGSCVVSFLDGDFGMGLQRGGAAIVITIGMQDGRNWACLPGEMVSLAVHL